MKALPRDRRSFDQLSENEFYTTNTFFSNLALRLETRSLCVQSDKISLHYEFVNGRLRIYVPRNEHVRRSCNRTQLPELLAGIIGVDSSGTNGISLILSSSVRDLYATILDLDISGVSWIKKTGD